MSLPPPALTTHRRLEAGITLRHGRSGRYRRLRVVEGEPHVVRDDLGTRGAFSAAAARPLLTLGHLTDLQIADVQSPARFEFFNREAADPRFAALVPVQRPQEALTPRAVEVMVGTLNRITGGPVGGAPIDRVVTTGDAIDNAQWNELRMFLALLDGGRVRPLSGGDRYEGVQARHWPDDIYWRPDGGPPDLYRELHGFPIRPRLLDLALAGWTARGLRHPWLACYGNHEALIQGVGVVTPAVAAALVAGRKPARLHPAADRDSALTTFIETCEAFLTGEEQQTVTPDPDRRPVTRREFVEAHFGSGARPDGHGFEARNRLDGTAYYCHDLPAARLLALDTTCQAGASAGSLDPDQLRWLEERLIEVSSSYLDASGAAVGTGNEDRLVVLFSHHGLDTLTNTRGGWLRTDGSTVVGAREVERLLHRFPNVVLWLNGHTHTNDVRARPAPGRPGGGFWEVTTSSIVDWPCQARLVELLDAGDGTLAVACTMVDHSGVVAPVGSSGTHTHLAGLHRELAANQPGGGTGSALAGTTADRNVVLLLRSPTRAGGPGV